VGTIFRFLRARGWSRAAIAAATGLSETRVRAVSQGKQQITSYEVLERIAEGLRIERGLMGLGYLSPADRAPASGVLSSALDPFAECDSKTLPSLVAPVPAGLDSIRLTLDAADLPPDGPIRPLSDLAAAVAAVVRLRLTSNYLRLSAILPDLLNELHRAYAGWAGQRKTAVAVLLTQAYRAADALADKSGQHDLSARIIAMLVNMARQSGHELMLATASYVRGELFFANGRQDLGRALLERAAERLVPGTDQGTSAAYGALHMRAAVLAGQAGQLDRARDHLAEAAEYARLVPEGAYHGTAFGPSSVRIHEVTLAIDTGDPDAALRAAEGWHPPDDLPGERRSHFYIDLARAYARTGAVDEAVKALFRARTIAPEHTRIHPQVHQLLANLLENATATGEVREYARWAGVSATVN
jgi:transcriptional regulator with XRE-family HTH domain